MCHPGSKFRRRISKRMARDVVGDKDLEKESMKEENESFCHKTSENKKFRQSHGTARCLAGVSGATATRVVELVRDSI